MPGAVKRVGLFGGTFDPPTIAHVLYPLWIKERLKLDEVWFVPAAVNPLKQQIKSTSARVRLKMLEAAIEEYPFFSINTCELDREGPSYTIDTVLQIKHDYPDIYFYLLLGSDTVPQFPNWKRINDLVREIQIVIMHRAGYGKTDTSSEYADRINWIDLPLLEISATFVRNRIIKNQSIHNLVPSSVEKIIKDEGLYY